MFLAIHTRHCHVCKDNLDLALVLLVQINGFRTFVRSKDPVTVGFQDDFAEMQNGFLVVHNKNQFALSRRQWSWPFFFLSSLASLQSRKINHELRSFIDLALYVDETTVAVDDPLGCGESEARPLSQFLGGEEWIEDHVYDLLRDPRSGILDGEYHIRARFEGWVCLRLLGTEEQVVPANCQAAAVGHGVARVDRQVYDNLVNLRGLRGYEPKIFGDFCLDIDDFWKSLPQ